MKRLSIINYSLLLFACVMLSACQRYGEHTSQASSPATSASQVSQIEIFNADLRKALQDKDTQTRPLTTIEFDNGAQAHNCQQYLAQLKQHASVNEQVANQAIKSEYLICEALALLQGKPFQKQSRLLEKIGVTLANKLDLRSFASSLRPRLDDQNATLQALFGNQLHINSDGVQIDNADLHFKLQLVAIAQLNNNDKQDWIVWVSDEIKDGNYRGYSTVVILDPQDKQILRPKTFEEIVNVKIKSN